MSRNDFSIPPVAADLPPLRPLIGNIHVSGTVAADSPNLATTAIEKT